MNDARSTAPILAPPPILFLGAAVLGLALDHFVPLGVLDVVPSWLRLVIGTGLAGSAIGLAIWAILCFVRAGTPAEPWHPTTALVTHGPFAYLRNPMYVALVALLLAAAAASAGEWMLVAALGLAAVLHWGVVLPEEGYLEERFGDDYTRYCERVRRYGVEGVSNKA